MIDDKEAVLIAEQWRSVMTWADPGVAMYSVTSTGKIQSELKEFKRWAQAFRVAAQGS